MTAVYLDHAASSPIPDVVREAMLPWLAGGFGNPSSVHSLGRAARHAVEAARGEVAGLLGCAEEEVIFTSGGTESNYLAIAGMSGPVVTVATEHDAVLQPARQSGRPLTILEPNPAGQVEADDVVPAVEREALVSVMLVNNELGTVNPVPELAAAVHAKGGFLHTDAVQAPAWTDVNIPDLGADLVSLSGHKIGGPKGCGVLVARRGVPLNPPSVGGGQERNRRGGTENVPAIVGMATAMRWQYGLGAGRADRLERLKAALRRGLAAALGDAVDFNSPEAGVAPHILNVRVPGVSPQEGSEMLILGLDLEGVAVSAGSACSSGSLNAGHVLGAIGRGDAAAIRYSLGWSTNEQDIDRAIEATARVVERVLAVT